MTKRRVSNFLILEVLIAFLLISMTILPFTTYPYRAFQKELSFLEAITIEPYFTSSFNEAFDQIDNESIVLEGMSVPYGKGGSLFLKRSAVAQIEGEKKKTPYSLITIDVTIKGKNCSRTRQKSYTIKRKGSSHAR